MSLQPERGDDRVAIPVTFDIRTRLQGFKVIRLYLSIAAMFVAIILWVIVMFVAKSGDVKIFTSVLVFILFPLFLRFGVLQEIKYKAGDKELVDRDYLFDYSLFWSIYDTSGVDPTVFHHLSGATSIFVAFDKDVIVGKGDDYDHDHFEAISEAMNLLSKKEITCTHLDYMDNVGKDVRLEKLIYEAAECPNPDLRNSVTDMMTYMQWYMSGAYADYDVYCFTSKLRVELFIDELVPILLALEEANYIRYRYLDRHDVRDLVSSLFSIQDFSVTRSCDSIFSSRGGSSYLKVIYTEVDGEKEVVNRTREQSRAASRIEMNEKMARKSSSRGRKAKNKNTGVVDLFDDDTQTGIGEEVNPEDIIETTPFSEPANSELGSPAVDTDPFVVDTDPTPTNTDVLDDSDSFSLFDD